MAVFGPSLSGENPEPLSVEEMEELATKFHKHNMEELIELEKDLAQFKIYTDRANRGERKPLGMPDDKPKRSLPKSED